MPIDHIAHLEHNTLLWPIQRNALALIKIIVTFTVLIWKVLSTCFHINFTPLYFIYHQYLIISLLEWCVALINLC